MTTETCVKANLKPDERCFCVGCTAERANLELQEAILMLEAWVTAPLDENFPEYHRYTMDSRDGLTIFWNERGVRCSHQANSSRGRADLIRSCLSAYHAHKTRKLDQVRRFAEQLCTGQVLVVNPSTASKIGIQLLELLRENA